jgi:CRP-like cAMP-binding protein
VLEALVSRTLRRSRNLSVLLAINSRTRVDERLHMLLQHLAALWGRVTPEGVVVPLPLTHEMLAHVVGAQRPSVTTAFTSLAREGLVSRAEGRGWLVREAAVQPSQRFVKVGRSAASIPSSDGP